VSYAPASQELIDDTRRKIAVEILHGRDQPRVLVRRPLVRKISFPRDASAEPSELAAKWHFSAVGEAAYDLVARIVPGEYVDLPDMPQACRDLMAIGFKVIALGDTNGKLPPEFPEGVLGARDIP
jgi:hypothetical protein